MACSKYILTNTGSTLVNFNYRRCDDSMWEYQVELNPNQTKNIWLIDNTYSIAPSFSNSVLLVNEGVFPAVSASQTQTPTPTPTPTQTQTPTNTATNTPTPTQTPTQTQTQTPTNTGTPTNTPTPTNTETPTGTPTQTPTPTQTQTQTQTGTPTQTPTNTGTPTGTPTQTPTPTSPLQVFNVFSGNTSNAACDSGASITLYGFYSLFDANTQFYNNSNGTVTINLAGFYSDGTSVTELSSGGTQIGSFTLCSVLPSPTPTSTPTNTPTNTPTTTATNTPTPTTTLTPTATFGYYTYSLGTGATSNDACTDFGSAPNTIYGTVSGGIGPNVGEYLYQTAGNPPTNPVANGYYSNGTAWYQVTGGLGQITSSDPNGCP
jgi:hypothetical protein